MKPESAHEAFEKMVNNRDIEGLYALYEPDAALIEHDGNIVTGADSIRETLVRLLAMKPLIKIKPVHTIDAGTVAVLVSKWEITGIGPDEKWIKDSGRTYAVVRKQQDETWRIAIDNPWGIIP
jgi:uncharacterized protein (TIGR02246 family)